MFESIHIPQLYIFSYFHQASKITQIHVENFSRNFLKNYWDGERSDVIIFNSLFIWKMLKNFPHFLPFFQIKVL